MGGVGEEHIDISAHEGFKIKIEFGDFGDELD